MEEESSLESMEFGLATNIDLESNPEQVMVVWGTEDEDLNEERDQHEDESITAAELLMRMSHTDSWHADINVSNSF